MQLFEKVNQGVEKSLIRAINERKDVLRHMKSWYLNEDTVYKFTYDQFYGDGYRIMKEIEKLEELRLKINPSIPFGI